MNQKRKNGFTLIELLAVIVILAIIALIAVPVIMNIINKANKSAFKDTAYGVIQAGELYFAEQQLELNGMQKNVEIELPDERLQMKGTVPEGQVKITNDGKIEIAIHNDRYCVTKGLDDTDVTVTDDIANCNLPSGGSDEGLKPLILRATDDISTMTVVEATGGTQFVKVSDVAYDLTGWTFEFYNTANGTDSFPLDSSVFVNFDDGTATGYIVGQVGPIVCFTPGTVGVMTFEDAGIYMPYLPQYYDYLALIPPSASGE